ncbi:hypothetical protein F6U93_08395 [Tamlana haliotis]|uniref:Uncharacterized protein n=1 Tax=Pseudotamlana haliotis TaxID=2614804 RepID=A0A6N6MGM4_9FLAO|nr:hypothetical protein [Tamlana haliotis]KAB1067951.1 hypothetical protein F6U93_08395 [Tamlana haliotis]
MGVIVWVLSLIKCINKMGVGLMDVFFKKKDKIIIKSVGMRSASWAETGDILDSDTQQELDDLVDGYL